MACVAEEEHWWEGNFLSSVNLEGADLFEANLSGSTLCGVNLDYADLSGANLRRANLAPVHGTFFGTFRDVRGAASIRRAYLRGASLCGADMERVCLAGADLTEADLSGADLTDVDLSGARLERTKLRGAAIGGVTVAGTMLIDVDLSPLCEVGESLVYKGSSYADHSAIARSLGAPRLKDFLQRIGMPEIFVEYMVECARAMDGRQIKKLLQSTFISYGGPDEPFARRLYEALHRNGVTTFFFPEHAKPGQRIGRVVRENVESYDRILLLCSRASLERPGVLYEIEEALERERRDGGAEYLIPVILDDFLRSGWEPERRDVARTLRDRVYADFRGANEDEEVFRTGLQKLIAALRPPLMPSFSPPTAPT